MGEGFGPRAEDPEEEPSDAAVTLSAKSSATNGTLCDRATKEDLEPWQGRWQHTLNGMGLLSVYGDVALFDRGSGLRIGRSREHEGALSAGGWLLCPTLSDPKKVMVWAKPGTDVAVLQASLDQVGSAVLSSNTEKAYDWCTSAGVVAWLRVGPEIPSFFDRFAKLPVEGILGLPERVSIFTVPPPADMPTRVRPWRFLVYGGCLTIGWPSGDSYSRSLIDQLGELGVYAEAVGCGISAHLSDQLAAGVWRRDFVDKMGLRGEGILRLLKRRGPFDLVLIMVGIADIVRGKLGDSVISLHRACHEQGASTIAIAVPPSWHDNPEKFEAKDLTFCKKLDDAHNFEEPSVIARTKSQLNERLRSLAPVGQARAVEFALRGGDCALFVDTADLIPCCSANRSLWHEADWIHLTAEGNQCLGRGVGRRLAPLLQSMAERGSSVRSMPILDTPTVAAEERDNRMRLSKAKLDTSTDWARSDGSTPWRWCWRVVGGGRAGGLVVRYAAALNSEAYSIRLRPSAEVEALEIRGNRMRYSMVRGFGPHAGWVSISLDKGKEQLIEPSHILTDPGRMQKGTVTSGARSKSTSYHWRCEARPGLLIRSGPWAEAPIAGFVRHGEVVAGERQASGGRLKLSGSDRFMLVWQDWKGYLVGPVLEDES